MTNKLKKFFKIETNYTFEWNDLRAVITLINVLLIMKYGLKIAWFGLAIAVIGLIKNLTGDRRINSFLMYLSNIALNIYFISQI